MKSVLVSLLPYWYYLIGEGIKTSEVRKKIPKAKDWNGIVECYMTKDKKSFARIPKEFQEKYAPLMGKVGMRFVCDGIDEFTPTENGVAFKRFSALHRTCLSVAEIREYLNGNIGYGWHISDLKIYDKPRELSEFFTPMEKRPSYMLERSPQSWCYVEEV